MKAKILKVGLIIVLIVASLIPIIEATFITIYPLDSEDDAFVTGIGNYFGDTSFLPLRGTSDSYVLGTRFRNVAIPQGSKINNATLRVKSFYGYPSATGITVTITGDDADNSRGFNDSGSFSRTYTLAFVVWDISNVNGNIWSTVDVTEIIQEIIDRVGWSSGNSLSLVYFTDQGSPRREFVSLEEGGGGYKARIDVFYNVEPTPEEVEDIADEAEGPYNDTEEWVWKKNDTYRGIDIYTVTNYGDPMFQVYSIEALSDDAWYFNVTNGIGSEIEWDNGSMTSPTSGVATTPILGFDEYTLILADPGETALYVSDDEMATSLHYHPNDEYGSLDSYSANGGSIAIDPDGETFHIVYSSVTPGQDAVYNIVYTNFTLDSLGIPTFSSTFTNLSQVADTQHDPVIYVQPNGTLHVAWHGEQGTNTDQIWYRRRHANGTWLAQVRVSDTDVALDPNKHADVVANDETGEAMICWTLDLATVEWDMVFPNNTASPADRSAGAGRYPSMVNDRETNTANMVYQLSSNGVTYFRNKTISNSSSWSAAIQISPAAEKHQYPDIGINPDERSLTVIWYNDWNEWTAGNWWKIGQTPIPKKTQLTNARLRWNFIEEIVDAVITDQVIFLVYPNGTLVNPDPLPEDVDPEDAIDDLLGGAQPEDPETDVYGTIGKFRWKLLVMAVGFIMLLGPPMAGIYGGASGASWIKILFVMCFGLAILSSLKFM